MKWGWISIINQDLISLPENFVLFFEAGSHYGTCRPGQPQAPTSASVGIKDTHCLAWLKI